jgi:hypothetical protein
MASTFRPSTPADAPQIAALCRRILDVPPHSPMFSAEHMDWKYWQPWASWPGSRSYVLAREGRIVAHVAVLPLGVERGPLRATLLHPFDWASEPEAIGSGATLLQRLAALADGLLIVGGSTLTRRMAAPLGFRQLGMVERFVLGADVTVKGASELAAGGVWSTRAVAAQQVALPSAPRAGFERTAELLGAHERCPVAPARIFAAYERGVPRGGFVLSEAPGQVRISALWGLSPEPEGVPLVQLACAAARAGGRPLEVVCMANAPPQVQALGRVGFARCEPVPLFLRASAELGETVATLGFQMLDGDVAFLHHGLPETWVV